MLPCQDNYATTFDSYPAMLTYHETMSKETTWRRCKVSEMHIEPLDTGSPLFSKPADFSAGISEEAVIDTAANLGLALRVGSDLYPIRSTAYACTVHKSQGDEFKSVIINLQCAHSVMLVRPLIYTAITRAKERVIIVGERRALCIAIRRTDTEQRGTKLAMRIQEFMKFRREN